jgi:hypothetical protein
MSMAGRGQQSFVKVITKLRRQSHLKDIINLTMKIPKRVPWVGGITRGFAATDLRPYLRHRISERPGLGTCGLTSHSKRGLVKSVVLG